MRTAGTLIAIATALLITTASLTSCEELDKVLGEISTSSSQADPYADTDAIKDSATFIRAKDGDTYVIQLDGSKDETTVRLIGVDTPESVAPDDYYKDNTAEGQDVSAIVKSKLHKGDKLTIEYDVQTEDKYGRTLAYVYTADGKMIQDWLLENGYAQTMTIQPNSKYAEHFAEVQHTAAENKVGLWNGYFNSIKE